MSKNIDSGAAALAFLAGTVLMVPSANALTVTMDGTAYNNRLSDAVAAVFADDNDGPDIINITTDTLAMDAVKIVLDKPITINGDANGRGNKADILVDVQVMRDATLAGQEEKCYLEISAAEPVVINDLKIHPNFDNDVSGKNKNVRLVDAIRFYRPLDPAAFPTHILNRVWVSGSDADDKFVRLDTDADLYNMAGVKKWSRYQGNESRGIIQLTKGGGDGNYNATLNDCHAGLGYGHALNLPAEVGAYKINGGLYGHCGRNGIRMSGDTITLTGSATNRLRVVRAPNQAGVNCHGIYNQNATLDIMEYVDVATIETGNNMRIDGGQPMQISNCRFMGKLTETSVNPTFYIGSAAASIYAVDSTFVGSGLSNMPLDILAGSNGVSVASDCIFSSENLGQIRNNNNDLIGSMTFNYCAIPTDSTAGESLDPGTPIITATDGTTIENNSIHSSPNYMLTRAQYDWSESQGDGQPGNLKGNRNVYRPSNPAYLTASSTGGSLIGGAGASPSGISINEWMLLED